MKAPVDRENTKREIKKILAIHGIDIWINQLVDRLSASRRTLYQWFHDHPGMIEAGVEAAQLDLLRALDRFRADLKQKEKAGESVSDLPISEQLFIEYCRLLGDEEVCGGVVLRAAAEATPARRAESLLHQRASEFAQRHVRYFQNILQGEKIPQSPARARLLVAMASGDFLLPRTARDKPLFNPATFFEMVMGMDLD
jgi:AcrR family transcriptional regulator